MRSSSVTAISLGMLLVASASSQAQDHVYNLNGTLADAFGGPSLSTLGGSLAASGFTFGFNEGLSLTGVVGSTYTIAMRFRFDEVSGYRRIKLGISSVIENDVMPNFISVLDAELLRQKTTSAIPGTRLSSGAVLS